MNLVVAKCPSCGAGLKVNPKIETTRCDYCKQLVIVDEAIERHKLEIEIKNMPSYENVLKLANRHYCNKEYDEAYKLYRQLLMMDADDTLVLLRYGICKTLINNYIDFTVGYLINTFDNVINISKENNEYNRRIGLYVYEVLHANNICRQATINYYEYNSTEVNSFDLAQIQSKMISCLKLYEKLFEHSNYDLKKNIAFNILLTIDFIEKNKTYRTGKGLYGRNIIKKNVIDKDLKAVLDNKKKIYDFIINNKK